MGKRKTEEEKQATRDARNKRRREAAAAARAALDNMSPVEFVENAVPVSEMPTGSIVLLDGDEHKVLSIGQEIANLAYLENSPLEGAPKIERYQRAVPIDTLVVPV